MLERLFNSVLMLSTAVLACLAAWSGRRHGGAISALLGLLGVLALGIAVLALVQPA